MNDSPVKLVGGLAKALGLGAFRGMLGKRPSGRGQRMKALEQRVSALEGGQQTAASATGAIAGSIAGAAPSVVDAPEAAEPISVEGTGLDPNMELQNNALGANPMRGLQAVQEKIAAPGPLSPDSDQLSELFTNINY